MKLVGPLDYYGRFMGGLWDLCYDRHGPTSQLAPLAYDVVPEFSLVRWL